MGTRKTKTSSAGYDVSAMVVPPPIIAIFLQKRTYVALFFPYEKGKIEFIAARICVRVWTLYVCVKESDKDRKKEERSGEKEKTGQ